MDHRGVVAELEVPHVLIFSFAAQGHVNPMLKLAELICLAGIHVTFVVTEHTQRRLLRNSNVQSRFDRYPGFHFEPISDGLPEDDPRSGQKVMDFFHAFGATAKPLLREMLVSHRRRLNGKKPVTCVIADGFLSFAIDVAEELGIPAISFRTSSTCNFWAYLCVDKLVEAGELPFDENNLDAPITSIPGMEHFLRCRDLPSFFRIKDVADRDFQLILNETLHSTRAQAQIFNTFEELEGPILSQTRSRCPKIYTIGPLHDHLKIRLNGTTIQTSSTSLWKEDTSCMKWLDAQPFRSVIYVSFGSLTMVTKDKLIEFWYGLVNSGKRFLWVIRPDSVTSEDREGQISPELEEGIKERGYMVGWAPQEEVLAHQAIGGFITHSGWNSTLESIVSRVPMICLPSFGDQQINSRYVEEIWNLGLDMKDTWDRLIIEKMVKDLMDVRREEFMKSINQMAKFAKKAVSEGGLSYCNLDRLIEDIKLMSI
ncbi:unnamed protein product [Camellia sinensis]